MLNDFENKFDNVLGCRWEELGLQIYGDLGLLLCPQYEQNF